MRPLTLLLATSLAMPVLSAPPAIAKERTRYEYDGRVYRSYAECRAARKRAAKRGTVIGAAGAGVGTALLGGGLGGSLLAAGAGAVIGHEVGKSTRKC